MSSFKSIKHKKIYEYKLKSTNNYSQHKEREREYGSCRTMLHKIKVHCCRVGSEGEWLDNATQHNIQLELSSIKLISMNRLCVNEDARALINFTLGLIMKQNSRVQINSSSQVCCNHHTGETRQCKRSSYIKTLMSHVS